MAKLQLKIPSFIKENRNYMFGEYRITSWNELLTIYKSSDHESVKKKNHSRNYLIVDRYLYTINYESTKH